MVELTRLFIYMYTLSILMNKPVTAAAMDNNTVSFETSPTINSTHDQDVNQHSQLLCFNSTYSCSEVSCSQSGPSLALGYCATYSEDTGLLSIFKCPYFQFNGYNVTNPGLIQLPRNLTELNDYMCGPLSRKGLVCSECADGFGPSVTSFGYRCANCTDAWYGVPLFLFLEFVPVTVFYLIILVFQISMTSAPMPCFIMCAQFIVTVFNLAVTQNNSSLREIMFTEDGDLRLDMKITRTLYGVFNLDFFQYILPPFCISSRFKFIHISLFAYFSAFYPLLLICLTWVCVELHGRNLRPLVWLWRPFHSCFVRLRRGWDTKSDIMDVFTTFFLLSYSKCMYQTLLLLSSQPITNVYKSGNHFTEHRAYADPRITYGSTNHLLFVTPVALISSVFCILPPLVLTLYPIKAFTLCLSRCHLNSIAVNIFVDKVHGCYRNGLDGGRDMRSFSGLYFLLRVVVYLTGVLSFLVSKHFWFPIGTVILIITLTVALIKPYQKTYINYVDTLLLSTSLLLCYVMSSEFCQWHVLLIARMLFLIPIAVFILIILVRKLLGVSKRNFMAQPQTWCCRLRRALLSTKPTQSSTGDTPTEKQPLIRSESANLGLVLAS